MPVLLSFTRTKPTEHSDVAKVAKYAMRTELRVNETLIAILAQIDAHGMQGFFHPKIRQSWNDPKEAVDRMAQHAQHSRVAARSDEGDHAVSDGIIRMLLNPLRA